MTTYTWNGSASDDFNTAANWTAVGLPGAVPGAGDAAEIGLATTVLVQLGNAGTDEVDSLSLTGSASLEIGTGHFIIGGSGESNIAAGSVVQLQTADLLAQGTIVNLGSISLLAGAVLQTSGPTLTVVGFAGTDGEIQLAGGDIGGRVIEGGVGVADTLVLAEQTIDGFGAIGRNGLLDTLTILLGTDAIGTAAIAANAAADLRVSANIVNDGGTLLADGGTLVLTGSVDDAGAAQGPGSIVAASGANSLVQLDTADISGGYLTGGLIEVISTATLDGTVSAVTVTGTVSVDATDTLLLLGTIAGSGGATLDPGTGTVDLTGADVQSLDLAGGVNMFMLGALSTIDDGTTLDNGIAIGPGQTLAFAGTVTNAGTIALAGTPDSSTGIDDGATMDVVSIVTLAGTGTVAMSDQADQIAGGGSAELSLSAGNILGFGTIGGLSQLNIATGATIEATGGGTLVVDAASIADQGFLGAAAGSTLIVIGSLDTSGGVLGTAGIVEFGSGAGGGGLSSGNIVAGQTVTIGSGGASFTGLQNAGEILTTSGALLQLNPATTNTGTIVVNGDATLSLTGSASNSGLIALQGFTTGNSVHAATLQASGGTTTLSGGGSVTMQPTDRIVSQTASDTLDNVDNIVSGSGAIGAGALNLVNTGTLDANVSGGILTLDVGTGSLFNAGLAEATAGGTLAIGSLFDNFTTAADPFTGAPYNALGGTVQASGAGSVVLLNGTIADGVVSTGSGGVVEVTGDAELQGGGDYISGFSPPDDPNAMSLTADVRVLGGTLTVQGDLNNFDTISVRSQATGVQPAELLIGGAVTAEDGGTILLGSASSGTRNSIGAAGGGGSLVLAAQTVEGFGQIGDGTLALKNESLIDASAAGQTLLVQPAATLVDQGTLEASAGVLVLLGTISQTQYVGVVDASGTGVVQLGGVNTQGSLEGADIVGGVLTSSAGGFIETDGAPVLFDGSGAAGYPSLYGEMAVRAGDTLTIAAGLLNFGTLALQGVPGDGATLLVGGAGLTLAEEYGNGGDVTLASTADVITGSNSSQSFVNQLDTISGSGNIGGGLIGVTNQPGGIIDATGAMVLATGNNTLQNGGLLEATTGRLTISGAVDNSIDIGAPANSGTILASLGTVEIDGSITGTGALAISGGTMLLQGSIAAGQTISFKGYAPATLELGMATAVPLVFASFQSVDTIDLENVVATGSSYSGGELHVVAGARDVADLQFPTGYGLSDFALWPDGHGGTDIVYPCFAAGTRILTERGEVAVEALRVGDAVVTPLDGKSQPVQWLGHRRVDCRRHPQPRAVWPVRVKAGAFGPAIPRADLLLSPDHAVFVADAGSGQGVLIPIRYLVNGRSIAQEQRDAVVYWHVELPRHGVVLAEGLPAESYLDTGNRAAFANGGDSLQLHPDFARQVWRERACAPLVVDGPLLLAAKRMVMARALAAGWATTGDPCLTVRADGGPVPARVRGRVWQLRLPPDARSIGLSSRTWVPAHMRPGEDDTRSLGVAVARLWLDRREVSLASASLASGWHEAEPGWRWTAGDAHVRAEGARELMFELALSGTYWRDAAGLQTRAMYS